MTPISPAKNDSTTLIKFDEVSYRIDGRNLISGLTLGVRSGETMILLGRSGSGKTTSLKLVNGLLLPTLGSVVVDGMSTTEWEIATLRRRIGYAIQNVGLFPHLTVKRNVGLLLKLEGWGEKKIEQRVFEMLELVALNAHDFGDRFPDQLSGGQKQRVGLARALALDPPILLMDEPFGALDALTRAEIQRQFRQLQQRLRKTVVFVTHDIAEALLLGDRIALIEEGSLRGVFAPADFVNSSDPVVNGYLENLRLGQQAYELIRRREA